MKNIFFLLCLLGLYVDSTAQAVSGRKEIKIKKGDLYLAMPVNSSDPLVTAEISRDGGEPLHRFTINLANGNPEFWTYVDVSEFQGKTLVIELATKNPENPSAESNIKNVSSKGLNMIFAGASYPGQDSAYQEKDRPQIHFSAQRGWLNDPNGLIYRDGEYHLYFQHNPYGWQWGNMHWGHAVSSDLLHWRQLKEAIYPVIKQGVINDAAFSGSAVLDPHNTAGFRKNGIDPIIAAYTSTGRGECLQLSYDNGRTFADYEGNPVLKHQGEGRDPKVFWYGPGSHWVMVVWVAGAPRKLSNGQQVLVREHSIFTSPDLKKWTYQSGVSGFFECPDLFELPVEGKPGLKKWVMYDASGRYVVGDFNGKEFSVEQTFTAYDHGGHFYAAQTYNNAPGGRRIQVGWGRDVNYPGMPFNQVMLFPTELTLKATPSGYRLCPVPVNEINSLHRSSQVLKDIVVTGGKRAGLQVDPHVPIHVIATFERGNSPMVLNLLGYEIKFDNEWIVSVSPAHGSAPERLQSRVPYAPQADAFKIEAIVDRNVLEIFINDGELYYAMPFYGERVGTVEAIAPGKDDHQFIVRRLEVHQLSSIWTGK